MISITGSEPAGVEVAKNAAATVKRVGQELGGKSANIVLDDAELAKNVAKGVAGMMVNSGQTCSADLAHAGAEGSHERSHRRREGGRRVGDRGRSRRQFRHGAGGLEEPVQLDPGLHPEGHRRGRARWSPAARADRKGSTRAGT